MKYYITGRVMPERTDVSIPSISTTISTVGTITFECTSSQINMSIDTEHDEITAFLFCNHHASVIVSSLGFAKGCHYSIELISIMNENSKSTVFGVQIPELAEKDINSFFDTVIKLSFRDLFFRFAVLDYTKSIATELELPFLCYRAIESIKSRFLNDLRELNGKTSDNDAWEKMHDSLQTSREDIIKIKKIADPIRHGNYYSMSSTSSAQRLEILQVTKAIILKYKWFLEKKHQISQA